MPSSLGPPAAADSLTEAANGAVATRSSLVGVRKRLIVALLCAEALLLSGCGGSASTTWSTPTVGTPHRAAHSKRREARARSYRVRDATPQPGWRRYSGPVPILVYHDLGNPPASEPYPGLYVSDANFVAELRWLRNHGYAAVTLDEVMNAWFHGGTLPAKPIVITFDNGYMPQATFAPTVMAKYGWPGVLNEITKNHLANWRLRHLISLGWEIDSHSLTHPDLTTLPASDLRDQLVASRRFLRRTFHIPVNSFCYPSSRYNAAVIAAVKAAGYTNAVTENPGFATRANPYLLDRFEIEGGLSQLTSDLLRK
jgi:peptidoglycan/xylan/chitin deacetylase (PgdA/CDA1 family)